MVHLYQHYHSITRRLVGFNITHRNRISSLLALQSCRCASSSSSGGRGGGITIYNSLTSSYQNLSHHHQVANNNNNSNNNNEAPSSSSSRLGTAWYICGPTVYDSAHLGHGRTYVSLDILRRISLSLHNNSTCSTTTTTPRPLYVMNITDVDDKIIQRSYENSLVPDKNNSDNNNSASTNTNDHNPLHLARQYESEFWEDMDALNVLRPDVVCRVSEHVESTIVPYIEKILDGGMAYVMVEPDEMLNDDDVEEESGSDGGDVRSGGGKQQCGSVYFDVRAFESITNGRTKYGKLAPDVASSDFFSWENDANAQEAADNSGLRKKRDPRDFCLWKYRTQTPPNSNNNNNNSSTMIEPASVSYKSPWGPGRPGWHVECSAMIERLSQDFKYTHRFTLHGGGIDLKFPHHSNEIAQAEAYIEATAATDNDAKSKRGEEFEEWIPNWIHTGHLYVKGRKMSKSLKNFVTIREILGVSNNNDTNQQRTNSTAEEDADEKNQIQQHHNNNAWSCPSDDFRLWCLGLSGSYRGPATYSPDRIKEARVIRHKWIKFLIEGQECLDELRNKKSSSSSSIKIWGDDDLHLFQQVTQSSMKCHEALVGCYNENDDGSTRGSFDLDGASFVKELTSIADMGLEYVQDSYNHKKVSSSPRPEEPLRFALETFRRQLDLVGFTRYTVNAGVTTTYGLAQALSEHNTSDAALLDEIAAFRSAIRTTTINGMRSKDTMNAAKEVLRLCDELRDDILPALGVELVDSKAVKSIEGGDDGGGKRGGWRRCSPVK